MWVYPFILKIGENKMAQLEYLFGYTMRNAATIDKVNDVANKLQNQLNNIQKRVSRLDRFNNKSRWINAGMKRR